ncbi:hypothetical protein CONCODRAFT_12703, partial [Conidiobolus coronatus NRRL 28638]
GQRLVSINIKDSKTGNYSPIDLKKNYMMTTLEFIAKGSDNILAPPKDDIVVLDALDNLLINYIKKSKTITPIIEGRIQIVNKDLLLHLF